jgi:hypothetical protein
MVTLHGLNARVKLLRSGHSRTVILRRHVRRDKARVQDAHLQQACKAALDRVNNQCDTSCVRLRACKGGIDVAS